MGNARTALFNWLYARHHGGALILRIEDTDVARSDVSYQNSLYEDLKWLGLDWDEGPIKEGKYSPYRQSERLDIYSTHLQKLIKADLVYPCYCTEEELEEERQQQQGPQQPRRRGLWQRVGLGQRGQREEQAGHHQSRHDGPAYKELCYIH